MTTLNEPTLWDLSDSVRRSGHTADAGEDPRFLREQLLTYIGNKRSLLDPIHRAVQKVSRRLNKPKIRILDGFSGSGVVSRFFKQFAGRLVSNDLEAYARVVGQCYLSNRSAIDFDDLEQRRQQVVNQAKSHPDASGFIRRLYAPRNEDAITAEDRVFYTVDNAVRIDSLRQAIAAQPDEIQPLLLAPLLSAASVHANTSGVFKGFYKDANGVGQYGGNNRDALTRIRGRIDLKLPVLSRFECDVEVFQQDANRLVREVGSFDLAYFDPPYNQHPYGSNYFMLNLLAQYEEPQEVSRVSGIAQGWQRSNYNKRKLAAQSLTDLLEHTDASHLLISYNSEGFISREEFDVILGRLGRVEVIDTLYNTFRGSRNLRGRSIHVKEHLFLVGRH